MTAYKEIYKENPFKVMLVLLAFLWIILLISSVFPIQQYGIVPRTISGLKGIFFAPFLHAGISHLALNSISLFLFGSIFIHSENRNRFVIFVQIVLFSGFGTWLIGRGGVPHIGASGVVYGLMGYVLVVGIFTRSVQTILVSLLSVIIIFILFDKGRGIVMGLLPGQTGISWESHLCGFVSGILLAYVYSKRKKRRW